MLGKNSNHGAVRTGPFIEEFGCNPLDRVAQGHELRLPCETLGAFHAREVIQGSVAYLAIHDFRRVQHREFESHSLDVMADDFSARQWHCRIQMGGPPALGTWAWRAGGLCPAGDAGQQERIETAGKAGNSKPTLTLT